MSLLKKLRESRNISYSDLAEKLNTSPEDIENSENNSKILCRQKLSSFAYYFGLSSEDLLDAINGNPTKITTSNYYILGSEDHEDGWWGHFGIRLNGQDASRWFPITLGEANRISNALVNISSRDEWVIVGTLNNRILAFKPTAANRLWLLDEAADQPDDDWETPWDGYSGNPGEFYKGLEEYYWKGIGFDEDDLVSDMIKKDVEYFTEVHDLDLDQVRKLVIETQIYNVDGSSFSHDIDGARLADIINNIEFEMPIMMLDLSNEDYYLYLPADKVSLIDMPKRSVDNYLRETKDED